MAEMLYLAHVDDHSWQKKIIIVPNYWAWPIESSELDWADFDLLEFDFVINLPRRTGHVGSDVALLDR
jgi:hypothetical protein